MTTAKTIFAVIGIAGALTMLFASLPLMKKVEGVSDRDRGTWFVFGMGGLLGGIREFVPASSGWIMTVLTFLLLCCLAVGVKRIYFDRRAATH